MVWVMLEITVLNLVEIAVYIYNITSLVLHS